MQFGGGYYELLYDAASAIAWNEMGRNDEKVNWKETVLVSFHTQSDIRLSRLTQTNENLYQDNK
jgi:hypothetical protein